VSIRRISLRQGGEATQVRSQAFSNDSSSGGVTAKIENVPIGKTGRRNPVTNVPNSRHSCRALRILLGRRCAYLADLYDAIIFYCPLNTRTLGTAGDKLIIYTDVLVLVLVQKPRNILIATFCVERRLSFGLIGHEPHLVHME